jgi:Protein of unknown function (DUF3040)
MNLNARERQALRTIEGGLAESDPDLVAKFATLTRLMAPKDGPAAEPSTVGRGHVVISSLAGFVLRPPRHSLTRAHSRWGSAVLALWLAVSCALIATAAVLSHGTSRGACDILVVHCDSQIPASPAGAR